MAIHGQERAPEGGNPYVEPVRKYRVVMAEAGDCSRQSVELSRRLEKQRLRPGSRVFGRHRSREDYQPTGRSSVSTLLLSAI